MEVALPHVAEATAAGSTILFAEAAAYHAEWFRARPEDYGADVRGRIELGSLLLATDYIDAQRARALCCAEFEAVFREVDALVTPTLPMAAPRRDQVEIVFEDRVEDTRTALTRFTRLFNALGVPTIAVPCGFTSAGLPASLQIAAKPFAEQTVLRLAHAYESRKAWRQCRPDGVR
jgi:aspartyl-tRNA(Asn)/glutamyl-tRNA(Gln) amidotransferase subunit A